MSQINETSGAEPTPADSSYQHLRRSPRFKAFEDRVMAVLVKRSGSCEPREIRGRILDLSAGGAKLAVPCEVALQEAIEVRFDLPELTGDWSVAANVCWARTAGGTSWRLGCSFVKELPESLLSELATHHYIDRRENDRRSTATAATVQWELTRETSAVQIQDVSAGGFNLVCAQPVVSGTRLRLLIGAGEEEAGAVSAVVRWMRTAGEGFILGCAYLEDGAARRVEQAMAATGGRTVSPQAVGSERGPTLASSASVAAPEERPARPRLRLNVDTARRSAGRRLFAAGATIGGSFTLLLLSHFLGPLGWAATSATMLTAAMATASYHRLTRRVLAEAAEAARQGKLC